MNIICINDVIEKVEDNRLDMNSDSMYWITVSPEELDQNNDLFQFHALTIHECFDEKQNAKLEFYDNYDFIVLNIIEYNNNSITSKELNVFLGYNYIVTVVKSKIGLLDELEHELINYKQNVIFSSDKSVARILYYIIDRIILNNHEILLKLENEADSIEIRILKNPDKKYLGDLIHLRRQVHRIRNYISPLRYVGDNLLCNDNKIIDFSYYRYFEQLNHRIEKLIYSMDGLVQYLVLVREAFESEIANKTNELMKIFTIITSIFLPLTLITGIFGMNFENLNIYSHPLGFGVTILFMILLSVLLFILFKKKKWL
jgi:magnesium transporter